MTRADHIFSTVKEAKKIYNTVIEIVLKNDFILHVPFDATYRTEIQVGDKILIDFKPTEKNSGYRVVCLRRDYYQESFWIDKENIYELREKVSC